MTQTLSNEQIYRSFLLGAKYVINEKDQLNAINVFPVADGDTGSNLASLMKSILLKSSLEGSLEETLKSISRAALVGARGNSGIIFASYIFGFSSGIDQNEIDIDTLIKQLDKAQASAYQAIETPVEGTMITLMRYFFNRLNELKGTIKDIQVLLKQAYKDLALALEQTKDQLAILKTSKVVDAGAKGYYHFLEGFIKAMDGEEINIDIKDTVDEIVHVDHFELGQTRYCTEVLIEGKDLKQEKIKHLLHPFGDSVVVAGSDEIRRVHIHTNTPEKVIERLEPVGKIIDQKVDDMKRQFEVSNHRKHDIALVTDSIADLPIDYIEANQIHVLNLSLLINDVTYFDKLTIENSRFYQLMNDLKEYPKSSQPNPKTIENLYSFLTSYYKQIIVITVSSKMSGTYQAFLNGKKNFKDAQITVIDSIQNSVAQGMLVKKASSYINQGCDYETIIDKIEHDKKRLKILVSVKTLKYMIRSGRLKRTTGLVGNLINLKPIISIDDEGMGIIFDKAFSIKSSDQKIFDHIKEVVSKHGIESYALVHINAPDRLEYYSQELTKLTGMKPDYVTDISTIVAMNAGVGSVAVSYFKKER